MKRLIFLILLLPALLLPAQDLWCPEPTNRLVNDYSGMLSEEERESLEQRLVTFDDSTSNQILVIITPTLHGCEIMELGTRIGTTWGVGQKTAEKMHRMGIFTGLDLRNMSLSRLTQEFGKMGQVFYDFSRGIDNRPVISEWERKSVSCEQTFESDISENAAVTIHLYHTVLELVRRIEKNDFEGRTLTLKVKFLDFQQITRSITVDHILRTKDEILPLAKQLMQSVEFHSHPIRLLGLGVSNQKSVTPQEEPEWVELELEFEPWPDI